jgi:hypothetical protein
MGSIGIFGRHHFTAVSLAFAGCLGAGHFCIGMFSSPADAFPSPVLGEGGRRPDEGASEAPSPALRAALSREAGEGNCALERNSS